MALPSVFIVILRSASLAVCILHRSWLAHSLHLTRPIDRPTASYLTFGLGLLSSQAQAPPYLRMCT